MTNEEFAKYVVKSIKEHSDDFCEGYLESIFNELESRAKAPLEARIEKLRDALEWFSPIGQPWVLPEHEPTREVIGKVARDAIAQDEEARG